jgi:hypothetical protein
MSNSRLLKLNLTGMQPTEEEVNAAKKELMLLSEKQKSAKNAGLRAYFKANPDPTGSATRGTAREHVLLKFMVVQARATGSNAGQESSKQTSTNREKIHDLEWMSEEQMDGKYGLHKATHWRATALLPERGDRISGTKARYLTEFACPNDIERMTEGDLRAFKQRVETELAADDVAFYDEHIATPEAGAASSGSGAPTTGAVPIVPTLTPEEDKAKKLEAAVESLKANLKPTIAKYTNADVLSDLQISAAEAKIKDPKEASKKAYIQELVKDLNATKKKIKS